MAYTCRLIEGSETAIVLYAEAPGYGLLDQGVRINDPEIREVWGGQLDAELVRHSEGKRLIPLKLDLQGASDDDLIDRVNALEKRLRHARRYHIDGWGDEVFLDFKLDNATHGVHFPVITGAIDKSRMMSKCALPDSRMPDMDVLLVCEPYWEDDSTYTLQNHVTNPGFWQGAAPGAAWSEVNAADVVSSFNTSTWEVMGQSLQMVISPDAGSDTGVQSANFAVTASTDYYFECRCYHTAGADNLTARVYDFTHGAVIAASVLTFDNQDDAWEKRGVTFATPVGCLVARVEILRLAGDSTAGDKTYYVDAVYLEHGTAAPTGWVSHVQVANWLDRTGLFLNLICASDIPGEVEAETEVNLFLNADTDSLYAAKRTRDDPHNFIWELLGVNAVVTAGDATCLDSVIAPDASAAGGQRVEVSFAGTQAMALRCYWTITSNLTSYYGKYMLGVIARATGATDTIKMEVAAYQDSTTSTYWSQGRQIKQTIASSANYELYDGWSIFSFPIGTHDDDLWGAGNLWCIRLYAETNTATPTDSLYIAGVYLIPLDEAYLVAGNWPVGVGDYLKFKDLDGDLGCFAYDTGSGIYYSNIGTVGKIPLLTPQIDNWIYFIQLYGRDVIIGSQVAPEIKYRPRGIFLRGSNP